LWPARNRYGDGGGSDGGGGADGGGGGAGGDYIMNLCCV